MTQLLSDLGDMIREKHAKAVIGYDITPQDELVVTLVCEDLPAVVDYLTHNQHFRFSTLVDITAVDYPQRADRFEVVYHFLSMYTNIRIRLKVHISEGGIVPSLCDIHPSANWFEREVFDMYGILFANHPDLRRLLTDYGFSGHPLRKDFPTTGYSELRYDEVQKRVVYEPVSLTQEYRQFDFMSPWEGAEYILPGDDKAGNKS